MKMFTRVIAVFSAVLLAGVCQAGEISKGALSADTSVQQMVGPLSENHIAVNPHRIGYQELVDAFLNTEDAGAAFTVCVYDTGGYTWELTVSGSSITGWFHDLCGYSWPVNGSREGLWFNLQATNPAPGDCYCDEWFEFAGRVDRPSRTLIGQVWDHGVDCEFGPFDWQASRVPCS